MKKNTFLLLSACIFSTFAGNAQNDKVTFKKAFFGIGTTAPTATLHVTAGTSDYNGYGLKIFNSSNNNLFSIRNDGETVLGSEGNAYGVFQFRGGLNSNNTYGDFRFIVGGANGSFALYNNLSSKYAFFIGGSTDAQNSTNTFVTVGGTTNFASLGVMGRVSDASSYAFGVRNSNQNDLFIVRNDGLSLVNGKLGVGDGITANDLHSYKLAVKGNIIAEGITIKPYSTWPDYVFDSSYKLTPLSAVKDFIKTNKHLPGIPSAREIAEKKAVEILDMNIKLLEKIEELYLHIIKKEEEMETLKKQITELEKKIK